MENDKKPSTSDDRHRVQRDRYLARCQDRGEEPNADYLALFDNLMREQDQQWEDPGQRENDLEWYLRTTGWILDKARTDPRYAQNIYAALCNNEFQRRDTWAVLQGQRWRCTWRSAGGIVADMVGRGDYMDWYCSGMRSGDEPDTYEQPLPRGAVPEGEITPEVREDLLRLGWWVVTSHEW
jgi:hypothetical protein